MQKLGFDQPDYDADQVLAEIADIVPFFKGITRERLGKFGLLVRILFKLTLIALML